MPNFSIDVIMLYASPAIAVVGLSALYSTILIPKTAQASLSAGPLIAIASLFALLYTLYSAFRYITDKRLAFYAEQSILMCQKIKQWDALAPRVIAVLDEKVEDLKVELEAERKYVKVLRDDLAAEQVLSRELRFELDYRSQAVE